MAVDEYVYDDEDVWPELNANLDLCACACATSDMVP